MRQQGEAAWGGPIRAGRHGRLYRGRDGLLFVSRLRCWSLPIDSPVDQSRRRVDLGVRERSSWHDSIDGRLYRDDEGRPVLVGVGWSGRAELARLRDRPPPVRALRWVDLLPRWVLPVLVLAAGSLAVPVVWWTGHPVSATVTYAYPTTASTFGSQCRAVVGAASAETAVPCPDPMPAVGDRVAMRALGWPLEGAVVSDGDLGVVGTLLTVGAFGACLVAAGLAMVTVSSRRRLTPVVAPTAVLSLVDAAGRVDLGHHLPLRALAEAVASREAHGGVPAGPCSPASSGRAHADVVRRLWWKERAGRLATSTDASQWEAVTVRSPRGAVHLLLFAPGDGRAQWTLPVTEVLAPSTTVTVLGAMQPGGLVAVHTAAGWVTPYGLLQPVDGAVEWALRQELTAALAIQTDAEPAPTVRA